VGFRMHWAGAGMGGKRFCGVRGWGERDTLRRW